MLQARVQLYINNILTSLSNYLNKPIMDIMDIMVLIILVFRFVF